VAQVLLWLTQYRYLAIFPLAVIEGPILTIICGFFASLGHLNLWLAYVIIVAGDVTGDALHYLFGYVAGERLVTRWGKRFGLSDERIIKIEKLFAEKGIRVLFFGKLTHGIGGAFLVTAGIVKMPFKKFLWVNTIGTAVKSLILLIIGYYFGQAFTTIDSYLQKTAILFVGIALIVVVVHILYFRKNGNSSPNQDV
jgi:membrane protein DedA with SNARE-associated domain